VILSPIALAQCPLRLARDLVRGDNEDTAWMALVRYFCDRRERGERPGDSSGAGPGLSSVCCRGGKAPSTSFAGTVYRPFTDPSPYADHRIVWRRDNTNPGGNDSPVPNVPQGCGK
jgi:hypothetical protein